MSYDKAKLDAELSIDSSGFGNTEKLLIKLIDKIDELIAAIQASP